MSSYNSKPRNKIRTSGSQSVKSRLMKIIFTVLFLGLIAGAGGYYYVKSSLKPVNASDNKGIRVEIPSGSSIANISQILEDKGIIQNATVFKYYAKLNHKTGLMAGVYELNPSLSADQVIKRLQKGEVLNELTLKITVPEGMQLKEIASIIAKAVNQPEEAVFAVLNDKVFLTELMNKYPGLLTKDILNKNVKYPLEGYLFPATYPFYTEKPTVKKVVTVMLEKSSEIMSQYNEQAKQQKLTTHRLLTMSSLIEEEATRKADRSKIASVFYNRLRVGMPLQTDPTVLYAKGKHKARVYYKDLEINSPYNTYKNTGLPPGPISNSGIMSIEAALNPDKTNYLFFLATSEGDVVFTKTLDEHNKEKAKHITNKK